MHRSMAVVLDSRTNTVVFWKVAPDDEAEDILDEAAKQFRSPPSEEPENELKDILWVEDEVYDYLVIPLGETEAPQEAFEKRMWKTK